MHKRAVDLGTETVLSVSLGFYHTCALLSNFMVKCFGANEFGQLGLGIFDGKGDDADEMGAALPAVDLGTDMEAVFITSGLYHNCAIFRNKQTKCWGDNR
jgi:hypothetical protein